MLNTRERLLIRGHLNNHLHPQKQWKKIGNWLQVLVDLWWNSVRGAPELSWINSSRQGRSHLHKTKPIDNFYLRTSFKTKILKREDLKPHAAAFSKARDFCCKSSEQRLPRQFSFSAFHSCSNKRMIPISCPIPLKFCQMLLSLISEALYSIFGVLFFLPINIFCVISQNLWFAHFPLLEGWSNNWSISKGLPHKDTLKAEQFESQHA